MTFVHTNVHVLLSAGDPSQFAKIIAAVNTSIAAAEPEITRLDTIAGDGDCGTTLARGAGAVLAACETGEIDTASLSRGVMSISNVVTHAMGGTSGALYAIYFAALAAGLTDAHAKSREKEAPALFPLLAQAAVVALEKLKSVTAAREGDRTMMDALIPLVAALDAAKARPAREALRSALVATEAGCKKTEELESVFGRASYVSAEDEGSLKGIADPGALGLVALVKGILEGLSP